VGSFVSEEHSLCMFCHSLKMFLQNIGAHLQGCSSFSLRRHDEAVSCESINTRAYTNSQSLVFLSCNERYNISLPSKKIRVCKVAYVSVFIFL
jgi:hypothetical protein